MKKRVNTPWLEFRRVSEEVRDILSRSGWKLGTVVEVGLSKGADVDNIDGRLNGIKAVRESGKFELRGLYSVVTHEKHLTALISGAYPGVIETSTPTPFPRILDFESTTTP